MTDDFRSSHCAKHGAFQARVVFPGTERERLTKCPRCLDEQHEEEERLRQIEAFKQRMAHMHRHTGEPQKFAGKALTSGSPEASAWTEGAAKAKPSGPLILSGTVGSGKSHTACSLMHRWIDIARRPALYVTAAEYCRLIRSTWSKNSEQTEEQVLTQYARAMFLVLDDLGAGKPQDGDLIQDLICTRYDADLMPYTIVSTNIAAPGFDEKFGERVADRLREGATLVEMTGASLRRPAA